jgi:hypothetical protein
MLQVFTPLALGIGLLATPADGAAQQKKSAPHAKVTQTPKATPQTKVDPKKLAEEIKKNGKLAGANYWHVAEARHRGTKRIVAAGPMLKPKAGNGKVALAAGPHSSVTVVGGENVPAGFGKGFTWDRAEDEALLVLFINAADPLGVSIDGLKAGDQVQVMSAAGIASFSKDKGNPLASSIVGLVAAGGNVALSAAGLPEVTPILNAAEAFAKDQFKATGNKRELRDAYGAIPNSGGKAREEGGILVCLPESGGPFYSGDDDHKNRWVQGSGDRTDDKLPGHIFGAFFPRQGFADHNTRIAQQDGQMYVVPWDWAFDDNAGYYKVYVKLKKGNGPPPPPVILRKTTPTKKK